MIVSTNNQTLILAGESPESDRLFARAVKLMPRTLPLQAVPAAYESPSPRGNPIQYYKNVAAGEQDSRPMPRIDVFA